MKNIFRRLLIFCLIASLVLPLPAHAVGMESEAAVSGQVAEMTASVPDETEANPLAVDEDIEPVTGETEEPPLETDEPEETQAVTVETVWYADPVFEAEESEEPKQLAEMPQTESEETEEPFSCYTFDTQGNKLNGYWAEEQDVWYLFVTSTQSLAGMELYYTGSVTETSSGELDSETGKVTGAFAASEDQVELTMADGSACSVVVMQSSLPSVYITLNGTTLDEIHASKDVKHPGNSVSIMDPNGAYNLSAEGCVEVKGRGNSTWTFYEKKGYQIKFDQKTSVMGMGKAKKWILLANAGDDSMMRTQLIYRMADELGMDFVPSFEYVDLWIDGEYRGTYMIGEKVEPGSSRLDLSNDAGVLFEHDEGFYNEEDYWFYSEMLQKHFALKEIVEEDEATIAAAMADFEASVDELAAYLYSTPSRDVTLKELSTMIDVDSFIKYYLINEFALNRDAIVSSFYWYKDGPDDVIHLGPIWDFDTCMGNDGKPYTESYADEHVLYRYLLAVPEFNQRAQELYSTYKDNLSSMIADADVLKAQIETSAEMNYIRWDALGKPNPKGGSDFNDSFEEAVVSLQNWIQGRESVFEIAETSAVTSTVSDNCYEMEIDFQNGHTYKQVKFAVWSKVNGQDDVKWYEAYQDSNGVWRYTVDLSRHNSAGLYIIAVYVDNSNSAVATGYNYVETAHEPLYQTSAKVSEDYRRINVKLLSAKEDLTAVRFAIWAISDQKSTLKWVGAEKDEEGLWKATVPICGFNFNTTDTFVVHAYGTTASSNGFLTDTTVEVKAVVPHVYTDDKDDTCNDCGFVREVEPEPEKIETVAMYRLYNSFTGEHFFTGSEKERDDLVEVGWNYEGVAWNAPVYIGAPVYRVFNPNSGDHHYTMSMEEVNKLLDEGWQFENVAWNCAPANNPESVAQYRMYNPNADLGCHTYTSSDEERDDLVKAGWNFEGIGWFGLK